MTEISDGVQAIIEAAKDTTYPHPVEAGQHYVVHGTSGPQHLDLTGDKYREFPQHKRGTVILHDVAAFTAYHAKHADGWSEIFADAHAGTVISVLDAHMNEQSGARWQQHRAVLSLTADPHWRTWTGADGQMMPQQAFAEFIEDNAADIAADSPAKAADLLELAQHFHAATKVTFNGSHRLASGETGLTYVEETTATAGKRGEIVIPPDFAIGVPPYEGGAPYRVKARFRYRLNGGELRLGYRLNRPGDTARDAFAVIITQVEETAHVTIMRGAPAAS